MRNTSSCKKPRSKDAPAPTITCDGLVKRGRLRPCPARGTKMPSRRLPRPFTRRRQRRTAKKNSSLSFKPCWNEELGGVSEETGRRCPLEKRLHRRLQVLKHRPTLLGTGDHDRPNALAPSLAGAPARPLRQPAVDGHEADCLFGRVVGRL